MELVYATLILIAYANINALCARTTFKEQVQ